MQNFKAQHTSYQNHVGRLASGDAIVYQLAQKISDPKIGNLFHGMPVTIISGGDSFSAAANAVNMLGQMPNVRIVGQTAAGGYSPYRRSYDMGNFSTPAQIQGVIAGTRLLNPAGQDLNVTGGAQPHIPIKQDLRALQRDKKDNVLNAAFDDLRGRIAQLPASNVAR